MATEEELQDLYYDIYERNIDAQYTLSEMSPEQELAFAEIIAEMTVFGPPEEKKAALLKMEMSDELRILLARLIQEEYIRTFSDPTQWGDFTKDQKAQINEILDEMEENFEPPPQKEVWEDLFGDQLTQPLLQLLEHLAESKYIKIFFSGDLSFNGIKADGEYAVQPMPVDKLASIITGELTGTESTSHAVSIPKQLIEKHEVLNNLGVVAKKVLLYEWSAAREAALLDASTDQIETLVNTLTPLKDLNPQPPKHLMDKLDVERQKLILNLSQEQARSLVNLINRPWIRDNLEKTLWEAFSGLGQAAFMTLLDEQEEILDNLTATDRKQLFSGVDNEQQQLLETMLEEQRTALKAEKKTAQLQTKVSFGIQFPTTPDVKDPTDISQSGWGIIFPKAMPEETRERIKIGLKELLDLRKAQAGPLFRIYEGEAGYRDGDTKSSFLQRHRVGAGLANPKEMPFYILLIGSPEEIPYDFEDQLDVMRGVGRLDFGEDYEAYAQYAHNVVLAESGQVKLPRKGTFFSVANPGDKATQLSARYLIRPLQENLSDAGADLGEALNYDWRWETLDRRNATHGNLYQVLGGEPEQVPAFLMTASHGMEFNRHNDQEKYQGALLCGDWKGPNGGKLERKHYFAGEDLAPDANVLGMITVLFACYGAGTPRYDQFAMQKGQPPEEIAPRGAFVADLPKQLLKHGALAVLGHVERAWGYSFIKPTGDVDNAHFVIALRRILNGQPIGFATDLGFDLRYADMSSELSKISNGEKSVGKSELVQLWTANNDARGYAIIGDPAARITFAKDDEMPDAQRPALTTQVDWAAYVNHLQAQYEAMPDGSEVDENEKDAERKKRELKAAKDKYGALLRRHREIFLEGKDDGAQGGPAAPSQAADAPEPSAPETEAYKEPPPDETAKASAVDKEQKKESPSTEDEEEEIVPDPAQPFVIQIADLETSLKKFSNQIAQAVKDASEDILTLDVETYSTDDLPAIQRGNTADRQLRAFTRVKFDGDMENYVPTRAGGGVDQELWQIHMDMVREAQANRAQFLQAMAELATNLLKSLKP